MAAISSSLGWRSLPLGCTVGQFCNFSIGKSEKPGCFCENRAARLSQKQLWLIQGNMLAIFQKALDSACAERRQNPRLFEK